jgi:hypothetical protein
MTVPHNEHREQPGNPPALVPPGPDACPPSAPFDAALSALLDHLLVIEDHQVAIEDHQLAIEDHQLAIAVACSTVRSLVEELLP